MTFLGETVYIFGGSQGIGFAIALELVRNGANVHIFARRKDVLLSAAKELKQHSAANQKIGCTLANVTNENNVVAAMSVAVQKTGEPNIVINCAGAAKPNYFESISADQFLKTLGLNVLGTRNVALAALPYLKQTQGQFVCTSSIAGFMGVFGYTDYSASKFAVVGFAEALQLEIKPHNVAVSVIYPPDTLTEGFEEEEKSKPQETRAIAGNTKPMTADQVASAVVKQLPKRRFHIFPSFTGRLSFLAKRYFPGLLTGFLDRVIKKSQESS